MSNNQAEPRENAPLFSVIIPLEFHRDQWKRSWQGWQAQTLDRRAFEIVLVVPPDFPERGRLSEFEGARLEYSDCPHDIGLCAAGAATARGQFLFFTESHCWPEPDVLALCLQAFRTHPDWAAFSCKSVRVSHNRLSEAEADMYEADIEYGMTIHPWRKILDQCFVTRRDAYEASGGLDPEFGHFSEWVLAASYFERGHTIGYLPEARIHHYYTGDLPELRTFTLDFVGGEVRYFSGRSGEASGSVLEMPPELTCQDNFDRDMARAILGMIVQDMLTDGGWKQGMLAMWRWIGPAISGAGTARGAAAARALYAHLAAKLALLVGSRQSIGVRFKGYIEALIHYQRLNRIRAERLLRMRGGMRDVARSDDHGAIARRTGFYPLEKFQGSSFRWSETAAAIRIRAGSESQSIRIKCAAVRSLTDEIDLRFYFNGWAVPRGAVSIDAVASEIRVDLPSGTGKLGWICRPFQATADSRCLGLPVMRVEPVNAAGEPAAAAAGSLPLQV